MTVESRNEAGVQLKAAKIGSVDVRVYEYGVRLDSECIPVADEQIRKSRKLYNDIIACLRRIYDEMQAWTMARAGEDGRRAKALVDALNDRYASARAANDEPAMRAAAQERRQAWATLSTCLAAVRKSHASELRQLFYSRIGRGKTQEPYQLRCAACADGLGWATANDVLERALKAWSDSMKQGRPPTFARGEEKLQDSLVLQFTSAGGVDMRKIIDGKHCECGITLPDVIGRRRYGTFRFRLGTSKAGVDATGTVQIHRDFPIASAVSARLVRRRQANKMSWVIQFVLRLAAPVERSSSPQATVVCVHFGWASDSTGRRVAGLANAADPGLARLVQLPPSVEGDLLRAAEIQSERDQLRDDAVPALKDLVSKTLARRAKGELIGSDVEQEEFLTKELEMVRRLPSAHIAAKRFYVLQSMLRRRGEEVSWLSEWVAEDRKRWQATVGVARRARRRRREFYRLEALELARNYSSIVIESLDLKGAAVKVDEVTGERSEFAKKARAGRVVASLYEFEQEIRKAAADYGRAVFELDSAPTIRRCASCGAEAVRTSVDDPQEVLCGSCGMQTERKRHGAAVAWQLVAPGIEDRIFDFHRMHALNRQKAAEESKQRKDRMAEGRRAARLSARADVAGSSVDGARET